MKKFNVVAIIPARAGSKGLKNKNFKKLNGIPLISHTIEAAKQSKLINEIIISTDYSQINKICNQHGIKINRLRPKNLSRDDSRIEDVILDLLKNSIDKIPDILIILQPTSPIRKIKNIDKSIQILIEKQFSSVIEINRVKNHPEKMLRKRGEVVEPFFKKLEISKRRQDLEDIFYPTGSIFVFWTKVLLEKKSIFGNKIGFVEGLMENIDIDDKVDFFFAEMLLKYFKNYKI